MFKLFRQQNGNYRLFNAELDTEGSLDEIKAVMESFGTPDEQIAIGFKALSGEDNLADYGINLATGTPSFIFSAKAKIRQVTRHVVETVVDYDTVIQANAA